MKSLWDSVPFLLFAFVVFVATFAAFLFFNDDLVPKILIVAFSGGFAIITGARLLAVTRGTRR